ncbi:MAG: ABC transporter permease [Anaerolineaceae bacterium]|jgi:simple sugar transport system permease protein
MNVLLSKPAVREFLRISFVILISLALGFIITLLVSEDPVAAYRAFLTGPLSRLNRAGEWIKESITLTLLGLAVVLVFKANIFSLGQDGQMVLGALVAGSIALFVPLPAILRIPLALIAGGAAGFLVGYLPGVLKAHLNANEIVSTLMINAIAIRFYDYILINFIKPPGAGYNASDFFPQEGVLPLFIPPIFADAYRLFSQRADITIMIYIAIILVAVVYFIMFRTPFGYELRMVGANMKFAHYGGVNIKRTVALSMAISGIFAGLAGAHLAMGIHEKLIANISVGLGFEGIIIALLARNNPLAVPITALAYGYLRAGADIMERTSDVSREMVLVIQAIIILLVTAERILPMVQRRIAARKEAALSESTAGMG